MKDNYLIISGEWNNVLHCPIWAGDPSGVSLGSIPLEGNLAFLALFFFLLTFHLLLVIIFVNLTMISFSDVSTDKNHVTLRISFTNVQAFNYFLMSEIFVSEDR